MFKMRMLGIFAVFTQLLMFIAAQTPSPQPCLICGGAVTRIWSMNSHEGDRYLRLDPTRSVTNGTKVDFAGDVDNHFSYALVKFKDVSTGFPDFETRIIMTFYDSTDGTTYHLQTVGTDEELRAIPENEAANLTDKSDVFSPVRLKFEHHLFFVFESVKHRNYYLGAKGNGQSKLVNTHSEAYRDSETLFKLIDPGNEIAGASFGNVVSRKRKRRAIQGNSFMSKLMEEMFPGKVFKRKEENAVVQRSTLSSIRASVKVPVLETFTLCFWIKTKDDVGQIFAIIYEKDRNPRIDVSIRRGSLLLILNGRKRMVRKCGISDGKWHHVCIDLQNTSRMFVYKDGYRIYQTNFRYPRNKKGPLQKSATVFLGRLNGSHKKFTLNGDLTQVNIWDVYPQFRIRRIATNSACGGGNIVQWKDFYRNTPSRDVEFYYCEDCPKRIGYNFDKKKQNNLV